MSSALEVIPHPGDVTTSHDKIKIRRALISVSDKTNIVSLAEALKEHGCEIISTGGTQKALEHANIKTTDISQVTQNPEAFGGRMKTISFQIESAILFDREKDEAEAADLGIEAIDLVVCNFYPFEKVRDSGAEFTELIENVDIGGPTMVRAAAKNFKYVGVLTDPQDYTAIINELSKLGGALSLDTRKYLMVKAFNLTADYDAQVAMAMDLSEGKQSLRLAFDKGSNLRYGENPHQQAMVYKAKNNRNSLMDAEILNGKQLSYNNFLDAQAAVDVVRVLDNQGCSVIKHNTPCGLAEGDSLVNALKLAWEGDPVSAFGSVIAFNRCVDFETVQYFDFDSDDKSKRKFVEVIIAPGYNTEVLELLRTQKNLRVLKHKFEESADFELRYLDGILLMQDKDQELYAHLESVTETQLTANENLIRFGLKAVRQIKSNAIAVVRMLDDGAFQLLGMGAGQPNRLVSISLAIEKCRQNLHNEFNGNKEDFNSYAQGVISKALLVSEAFFPFSDSIEQCAKYGIRNIIQPGGSIRDKSVIEVCNKYSIAMAFTGMRHFKH